MKSIDSIAYDFPLLTHKFVANCYMLLVLWEGEYQVMVNECIVENKNCKVVIVKPGDISQLNISSGCRGVLLCFEESFFSKRYHENVLQLFELFQVDAVPYLLLSKDEQQKIETMLYLMETEYLSTHIAKVKVLRSYLNILLHELHNQRVLKEIGMERSVKTMGNNRILTFLSLVEENFREAKTPSFYADKLCVTPNYLNKLCKVERGVTAGQMIRQRIAVEAKRMLQFSNLNIKELANELKFESTSYFVTFFKKQEGITPEEYRRKMM
jgi:AraC-like DNA-binding protein